ncbi:hypothetical protein [Shewanella sp. 10N.286.48.A6]|uniref:hypothetical protein n=1 Tax=Shewanella sp. 10N.286.48.A6 TaxID=1880833 RepID=UPI000C866A71|nr:hypothetical protein [Shewanella sp. 10N.286.48.A6]PMI03270.1 hypothetical protein BCU55_01095 [Shewanella sp. 10N.286.48.A6]
MNIEQVKQRIDLLEHFDYSLALFESNYKELMSVINFMCDEKVGLELFAIVNNYKSSQPLLINNITLQPPVFNSLTVVFADN